METYATPIRETPAASALRAGDDSPANEPVKRHDPDILEPKLSPENIQGSILTGFNKSHRTLLFLRVDRNRLEGFKAWLKGQVPFVATSDEVIAFNRLFKITRDRRKREGTVKSTWMNLAFSFDFLRCLNAGADEFRDAAFREGLAARSALLQDPLTGPFSAANWLVGGQENAADVLMIIEADDRADMLDELNRIQDSIDASRNPDGSLLKTGISTLFMDEGGNLPTPLAGHEHFGFLDGVSQPGLRGTLSDGARDVLTLRQNPLKRDQPKDPSQAVSPANPIQPAQGKPGQDLLYPGEFVFGYPKQDERSNPLCDGPNCSPGPDSLGDPDGHGPAGPEWARDGSFLVYRRLRQEVGAFHRFLRDSVDFIRAKGIALPDPPNASAARLAGSKLVGRWPSGAPVSRTPGDEAPSPRSGVSALGDDDCKNNYFEFQDDSPPIPSAGRGDPLACADDGRAFPLAVSDKDGARCPFSSHIRKVYPRDDRQLGASPEDPDATPSESSTQTHRMLRRGLPYGPPSRSTPEAPLDDDTDRGLQFLAYQTSIERQFEFVTNSWVNNSNFKELRRIQPDGSPVNQGGGHDPIIGQNGNAGEHRARTFTITVPDPEAPGDGLKVKAVQVVTKAEWVMPTGGGYFFTPSLSALKDHLT